MANPLEAIGISDAAYEAQYGRAYEKTKLPQDTRICICGHGARAHATESSNQGTKDAWRRSGRERCSIGRMDCPCDKFIEILQCDKVNYFTYKTGEGGWGGHALFKGVQKAADKGASVTWSNPDALMCALCMTTEGPLFIAAMTGAARVAFSPQPKNRFLCEQHYTDQGGTVAS